MNQVHARKKLLRKWAAEGAAQPAPAPVPPPPPAPTAIAAREARVFLFRPIVAPKPAPAVSWKRYEPDSPANVAARLRARLRQARREGKQLRYTDARSSGGVCEIRVNGQWTPVFNDNP